jgi:hypothetical protein
LKEKKIWIIWGKYKGKKKNERKEKERLRSKVLRKEMAGEATERWWRKEYEYVSNRVAFILRERQ